MKIRNPGAIILDHLRLVFIKKSFGKIGKHEFLLDLGCGVKPFAPLYRQFCERSVGIDVAVSPHGTSEADIVYDGKIIPFDNQVFDVVFCTEVMEHVPDPAAFLAEIVRVLKPGGSLIMTTPFMVPVHEAPYDYYRYTRYGIQHLLEKAGFTDIQIEPFGSYLGVIIAFSIQLHLKFWRILSNKTHLNFLYSVFNPFIFLFIVLPQYAYLAWYKLPILKKLKRYLSSATRGYGYTAVKV